jgi:dTDP-4-dehydrorhamnose reductase
MRLLITGASGQLGAYLLAALSGSTDTVIAWSGSRTGSCSGFELKPVSLLEPAAIEAAFRKAQPDGVVHAAARSQISECDRDPPGARQVNTAATVQLARLAAGCGARFVFVSTDLVFDGTAAPYREEDLPSPLSEYGRSKAAAEEVRAMGGTVVARVSLLFGPARIDRPSFFDAQITALRQGQPLTLFHDEWRTPLDLASAASALLAVVRSSFTGTLHIGGPARLSRLEMGQRLAAYLGLPSSSLRSAARAEVDAHRPRDTSLDSSRFRQLFPRLSFPAFEEGLRQMGLLAGCGA